MVGEGASMGKITDKIIVGLMEKGEDCDELISSIYQSLDKSEKEGVKKLFEPILRDKTIFN